jgi:hypothetical protein
MVGEVEELKNRRLCAFVRLNEAKDVGKITEVSLPTRFMFILLVPLDDINVGVEIGRCLGTLMTDEVKSYSKLSEEVNIEDDICFGSKKKFILNVLHHITT